MSSPREVKIGYIRVSGDTVFTPQGQVPLKGTQWYIDHYSETRRQLPTWAIVMACLTIVFFLVGILFLLVKTTVTKEYVSVTVVSGDFESTAVVPIKSKQQSDYYESLVDYLAELERHAA